jgi:hypothetical protein
MRTEPFTVELLQQVRDAVTEGDVIDTLGVGRPNGIVRITAEGIWVETDRSKELGSGPQFVPAWMVVAGWTHLRRFGRMSHQDLLNELNVKRSAFVCALLSRLPDVQVESVRPIVLSLR